MWGWVEDLIEIVGPDEAFLAVAAHQAHGSNSFAHDFTMDPDLHVFAGCVQNFDSKQIGVLIVAEDLLKHIPRLQHDGQKSRPGLVRANVFFDDLAQIIALVPDGPPASLVESAH
jgi:hypothetical protein